MAARAPKQRQSISLPESTIRQVRALARSRRASVSRTVAGLIENGLEAEKKQREHYLALLDRLAASRNNAERAGLKEELARLTFGG